MTCRFAHGADPDRRETPGHVRGPLTVEYEGQPMAIAGERERCLLGLLLLSAGVVPMERLIDYLWDERPTRARPAPCV